MKNRKIIYIIILVLVLCFNIDRVDAASEMACSYYKNSSNLSVYVYQKSNVKPIAYSFQRDGSALIVKNNITLKNMVLGADGYIEKCTLAKDVDTISDSKLKFKKNAKTTTNKIPGDKNTWNCSYDYNSGSSSYKLTVEQNKYGIITYSLKKGSSTINNVKLKMYGYSFGDSSCPKYADYNSYESDTDEIVFYKDDDNLKKVNKSASDEYIASANVNSSSVPQDSSNVCQKNGTNCKYANDLNDNSNVLIFENVGYCSKLSIATAYSDPNNDNCTAAGGSAADLKFRTSSYLILTYNSSTGMLVSAYLPGNSSSDSDINSRLSEYKSGSAKLGYVAELFDKYSYEKISALKSFVDCEFDNDEDNYCRIVDPDKIDWFNFTHGIKENEYNSEPVFWKKYGISLETLDNSDDEHPGGIGGKSDVTGTAAVYLCTYNDGDMIMKVNTCTSMTKISVFFPNNSNYSSGYYKYKIGEGTDDPVSWIGSDNHYGSVESGNTGAFEADLANKVCPKEVNYGATSSKSLTICYEESDCDNVGGYVGKNPVWSLGTDGNSGDEIEITDCSDLISDDLRKILNKYFTLFKIIVPILVIVLGTVDFAKAVFSNDDDMKKTQKTFIKRIIIAVAIFFIPTFVNLLMDVANTVWGWNAGTCDIEKNIDE